MTEEIIILKATKKSQRAMINKINIPNGIQIARFIRVFVLKTRFLSPLNPFKYA